MITRLRYLIHGWFAPMQHRLDRNEIDRIVERAEVHMNIPQQRRSYEE